MEKNGRSPGKVFLLCSPKRPEEVEHNAVEESERTKVQSAVPFSDPPPSPSAEMVDLLPRRAARRGAATIKLEVDAVDEDDGNDGMDQEDDDCDNDFIPVLF